MALSPVPLSLQQTKLQDFWPICACNIQQMVINYWVMWDTKVTDNRLFLSINCKGHLRLQMYLFYGSWGMKAIWVKWYPNNHNHEDRYTESDLKSLTQLITSYKVSLKYKVYTGSSYTCFEVFGASRLFDDTASKYPKP